MKRARELQGKERFLQVVKTLALVLFLTVAIDGFSIVSHAATGTVTAPNGAKVRKEATTTSEMIASAPLNKSVTINSSVQGSDGYTWYQVTFDGVTGYIRSDLMSTSDAGTTTATAAPTATPNVNETPVEVSAVNPVSATVKGGQSVRVRGNASTTSQIVTTVSSGLALTVTGEATGTDGKIWYQVNFISDGSSVEGFIRNDYVDLSEELTPFVETPDEVNPETSQETETTEPEEVKAWETTLRDGDWYLVKAETNQGWIIQDIFDTIDNNVTEYAKVTGTVKTQKAVIIVLVILLVAAAAGVAFLFFKMKEMTDAHFFNEVERETVRRRNPVGQGTRRTAPQGQRPPGARPAGAPQGQRPAGARPAGAPQGQRPAGARPAGAPQGQRPEGTRPVGAPQGQRPEGTRPAGAPQGQRPEGARPAGAPQGQRPEGARPAGAPQGQRPEGARPAGAPQGQRPAGAKPAQKPAGWQAKNFMADDDDEFEFEFLNYDGEDDQQ